MNERNFAQSTPEEINRRAHHAFQIALDASRHNREEAGPLSTNATLLGIQASLLERLERILLLLDERLPELPPKGLEGTVERG